MMGQDLEHRVSRAADAALAEQRFVSSIDVLLGLGWLAPSHLDQWRQSRVESLESVVQANPSKVTKAMAAFRGWASERGLIPSETEYVARTRDRRRLRFSVSGDTAVERAYRTHWVSPDLSQRAVDRQSRPPDLLVISPIKEWTCTSCGDTGDLLLMEDAGPLCLDCADLGHLVFLPSGDAALTRRAKKRSRLYAVVVRWSRSRKRYERQGIIAEAEAIERAEIECLSDTEVRARHRERDKARRADEDVRLTAEFAAEIRALFPGCPVDRAEAIARHAATRGSGRIGRSAAGRALEPDAVSLAVAASVRHDDTDYDQLLMSGVDRETARRQVRERVGDVLSGWRANVTLDALIAEATVDCYNDSECVTGFFTMLDEHLATPFQTVALGVKVTVAGVELTDDERIVAVCTRGRSTQHIPILDLRLPTPQPAGAEWLEAYRLWRANA
jgi:hypothetical protein